MAANVNNADFKKLVSVLRSLLTSRKGGVSTLPELIRDYRELEGENIPFQKMGFNSIDQLLSAADDFSVSNLRGQIEIRCKASQETEHITRMISAQKVPKRKVAGSFNAPARGLNPIYRRDNNRLNNSAYTNNYSKMHSSPMQSVQKYQQYNKRVTFNVNNNSSSNNSAYKSKPVVANNDRYKSKYVPEDRSKLPTVTYNGSADLRKPLERSQLTNKAPIPALMATFPKKELAYVEKPRAEIPKTQTVSEAKPNAPKESPTKPKMLFKRSVSNNSTFSQKPLATSIPPAEYRASAPQYLPSRNSGLPKLQTRLQNTPLPQTPVSPPLQQDIAFTKPSLNSRLVRHSQMSVTINNHKISQDMPAKKSVQDRMKINKVISTEPTQAIKTEYKAKTPSPTPQQEKQQRAASPFTHWDGENLTCIEKLERYCTIHKLERPQYKNYKTKSKTYLGEVVIKDISYSTYPKEYPSPIETNYQSALVAVEQLQQLELSDKYPVIMETDFDIAIKILECLTATSPNGRISTYVPDLFRQQYQLSLPENWFNIVLDFSQFFTVEKGSSEEIDLIFPNISSTPSPSSTSPQLDENGVQTLGVRTVKLELPWSEQHWNLYVTNPVKTDEIWARLIGCDFSDLFSTLITDIEVSMMTDRIRPISISIGDICLVCVSECWSRVRVDEIRSETMLCQCFNIDQGDLEWYPIDEIYVCEPRFLELPAQAVMFSLFGLEDFAGNPYGKVHLEEQLNFKVLIGDIISTQDEYDADYYSPNLQPRIKMVVYDTSSDEDINLNSLILKQISKDMSKNIPQLDCLVPYNRVVVMHIDEFGDIYCQQEKNGMMPYILKLIHNLVESNFHTENEHQGLYEAMPQSETDTSVNLYLVYDTVDSKWYRASYVSTAENGTHKMLFIDYGITRKVDISKIYRLNSLSVALSQFPGQAFKIQLAQIPEITSSLLSRLRGLLPQNQTALVKIVGGGTVPLVNLYIQTGPSHVRASVNEALRFENELKEYSDTDTKSPVSQYNVSKPASIFSGRNDQSSPIGSGKISPIASSVDCNHSDISSQRGMLGASFSSYSSRSSMSSPVNGGVMSKSDLPRLVDFKVPPIDCFFNVYITMAANPNYFIVQPYDDMPAFNQMMAQLQTHCNSRKGEFIPTDMIEVGQTYAGFQEKDKAWYRVIVQAIYGSSMINVKFCDCGEVAVLNNNQLKTLPLNFRVLPKQAIKAKLFGIKPKFCDWTMEDAVRFQELLNNKKFASVIKSVEPDVFDESELIFSIQMIDVSGNDDVYINDVLIQENRAIACIEDIVPTNE